MNKIDERITRITEGEDDRRNFFKRIYKYAIGLSVFGFASVFGLKRSGEIRLGKMKYSGIGPTEAYGMCSASMDCAGGGGQCSASVDCAGGGGQCSASVDCAGGGGQCSVSVDCAGGGGQCSASIDCAGS